jgi:purine nucleosidase
MPTLHLDTDLGGDIDDLCALAMVLNWPGAELIAVTTNQDDGGRRAGYTRYALDLVGRGDIPVAAGADISLDCYRVKPGLPEEADYWPEPVPPLPGPLDAALDLLQASIEQGALIVAIGAYTNLALLEQRNPGILRLANLWLMGGYVYPTGPGYPAWGNDMDWNLQVDIASSQVVLENSDPKLVPLTVTVETWLRRSYLPRLRQAGPLARLIAHQAEAFSREYDNETQYGKTCERLPDDTINWQHDPLAVAIALGWRDGVEISDVPVRLEVEDSWLYQRIDPAGAPTRYVTRVDGAAFSEMWVEIVTQNRNL